MSSGEALTVVIKTASGNADDLSCECDREWTISDLKSHLSTHHPLKPAVFWQRLIHRGKMLQDQSKLRSLTDETNSVVLHLVISPARSHSLPSPRQLSQATPSPRPQPPLDTTNNNPTTPTQDRRNPQAPPMPSSHSNRYPGTHPQYNNPWVQYRPPAMLPNQNMYNQGALPFPMAWPNPHMMAMHPYYAAQLAHWNNVGQPPTVNEEQRDGDEEGVAADDFPPDNEAGEQPDDINAGGAAGGFALMAENRRQRDLVDYLYMLMMMSFLGAIGYLTGSFTHFVIFFLGVAVIQMNQRGWFALQRRADAQHTEDVRQVNNNQQGDEPGEPEQDGERGEQEGEGQPGPSDETEVARDPTVPERPQQPGFVTTVFTFVVSFFTSLFPQQVPELQG